MNVPTEIEARLQRICVEHKLPIEVIESIFSTMAQQSCQLWMSWNSNCKKLLSWSGTFLPIPDNSDSTLLEKWEIMIETTRRRWERLVSGETVFTEIGSPAEHEEEEILDQEEGLDIPENNYEMPPVVNPI